jgi:phosphoribosylglycinamide formyltransferase-1
LALTAERFISEAITPLPGSADTARMAAGEPGLPAAFLWRGETLTVATVLRTWRETGRCTHGSPEKYARKHWFEIQTDAGAIVKIYFERQPRHGRRGQRWWLYSMKDGERKMRYEQKDQQ